MPAKINTKDDHVYNHDYHQSSMMMHYTANIIISIDYNSRLNLIKDRFRPKKGDISLFEAVEIFSDMLCQAAFDGRMEIFQEGMKIQLIDTITKTIKEGSVKHENSI